MSKTIQTTLILVSLLLVGFTPIAGAESLFRAGISYQTSQPYTPKSLYGNPRPATVGDTVTIRISETNTVNIQNNTTITRKNELTENSSSILNNLVNKVFGVKNLLPTVDGIANDHKITVQGQGLRSTNFQDTITCQVVQVLANGNLVVQGHKSLFGNKEEQDLYVTGIVNPFYLDSTNQVASTQVANFQMNVVGKGAFTRQQGDGIVGKYFQYIN